MHHLTIIKSFERVSNILVILVSALTTSVLIFSFLIRPSTPALQKGLQKGDLYPQLQGVNYNAANRTIIVALDSTCAACSGELPFYKHLNGFQRTSGTAALYTVFAEAESKVKEYLRANHCEDLNAIPSVKFEHYKIDVAPTLIVVDGNGIIVDFWSGALSPEAQQQVLSSVEIVGG